MNKIDVTIIIPIYKGEKYIKYWIELLKINFLKLRKEFGGNGEVIFVNDYPEERIEITDQIDDIEIKVYNMVSNQGIHRARIAGLLNAKGEYIVFLDQDDRIAENYLVSQMRKIENKDAVLCNGVIERYCMAGKRVLYPTEKTQKEAVNIDELISQGCTIMSPGQVMIRKAAIPDFWKDNPLNYNGSDDYFLWILLLAEGKTFNLNFEVLYTHVGHESNTSGNYIEINKSKKEMVDLLKQYGKLSAVHEEILGRQTSDEMLDSNRLLNIIRTYDQWLFLKIRGIDIEKYFYERKYNNIAIYGMNYIGNRLYDELKNTSIKVRIGIDRNADFIMHEIPVLQLKDGGLSMYMEEVDAVVVTTVGNFEKISEEIQENYNITVLAFSDILQELIKNIYK